MDLLKVNRIRHLPGKILKIFACNYIFKNLKVTILKFSWILNHQNIYKTSIFYNYHAGIANCWRTRSRESDKIFAFPRLIYSIPLKMFRAKGQTQKTTCCRNDFLSHIDLFSQPYTVLHYTIVLYVIIFGSLDKSNWTYSMMLMMMRFWKDTDKYLSNENVLVCVICAKNKFAKTNRQRGKKDSLLPEGKRR